MQAQTHMLDRTDSFGIADKFGSTLGGSDEGVGTIQLLRWTRKG
jgi:hypothetical protein